MTNREYLNSIATIDLLNCLMQHSDCCVLCLLGFETYTDRCDKFSDPAKDIDQNCYDCLCSWLNEKFSKNS